jgi:hypothetical protein
MKRHPAIPGAFDRLRTWKLVPTTCFAIAVTLILLRSLRRVPSEAMLVALGFVVASVVSATVLSIWRRVILRRVQAANCELCTQCLYPLTADAGVCPECGHAYSLAEVRAVWRPWLNWLSFRKWLTGFNLSRYDAE